MRLTQLALPYNNIVEVGFEIDTDKRESPGEKMIHVDMEAFRHS